MKYWRIGLLMLLGLIAWTGGVSASATAGSVEVRRFGDFEITLAISAQSENLTDVSVKNLKTDQVEFTITLPDVYAGHIRPVEYYPGHLYIIRRVGFDGYPDNDWADELWRYDVQGMGTKLYAGQGVQFRVAPDEQFIAAESGGVKLSLLDGQGLVLREFDLAQLSERQPDEFYADIGLSKWSEDSRVFWGELGIMGRPLLLYRLEADCWQPQRFDVSTLPLFREDELNPNTGQLVYSDYPSLTTVEAGEEFEKSGRTVTLFVYDTGTQKVQSIATSTAKAFRPIWLDDNTIEYDNPEGEGRLTFTLTALPADFSLRYHWSEAALPPPYHYEYTIHLGPGSQGQIEFWPDYPNPGTPVWRETFELKEGDLEKLYALLQTKGLLGEQTRQGQEAPPGAPANGLYVTMEGEQIALSSYHVDQNEAEVIVEVYELIKAQVPEPLWTKLKARYEQYKQDFEG